MVGGIDCSVLLSFLRFLKLHKLAVGKLDLSRGGSYSVSRFIRPWIKFTLEYPFKDAPLLQLVGCSPTITIRIKCLTHL